MPTLNYKNMKKSFFVASVCLLYSCNTNTNTNTDSDSDSDYNTVTIGEQVWMTNNLDVITFRNGDTISEVENQVQWAHAGINGEPVWCYYKDDPENGVNHGKLYNWHAVNDPRGLAPEGYHIPSKEEWELLIENLGGAAAAAPKIKTTNIDDGWKNDRENTNSSGLNVYPSGSRGSSSAFKDKFSGIRASSDLWTASLTETQVGWSGSETQLSPSYLSVYDEVSINTTTKGSGKSVRCIKD